MDENNYFSELEKIANEIMIDDHQDPMTEDPMPAIPADEVETTQAAYSEEDPAAAEEQLPPSPEETEDLNASVQVAKEDLEAAQEHLAQAEHNFTEFEKTAAPLISDSLPAMGAFAKLIDFSTNKDSDPVLHKLAQERLQTALSSDEAFIETLQKTAQELFEDEANLNALYTEDGMNYVVETLDSFADDEVLSKEAFEGGAVIGKAVDTIKEFGSATKNFWKLKKELDVAQEEANKLTQVAKQYTDDMAAAEANPATSDSQLWEMLQNEPKLHEDAAAAHEAIDPLKRQVRMGGIGQAGIGTGLAGGALFGGKKIYDATHSQPEDELSVKTAGVKMNPQKSINSNEGGKQKMAQSVVQDFLKLAGAAALLNISNDEGFEDGVRKEAAEQFNHISRMGRKDMEESFVKIATELYTEDQLHEIVAGNHNEEIFEKVAFFLAVHDASADELEKVAGADGVAAKGVAGALTDAKKEVEEHIKEEKKKSETGNLNPGSTKAQDTSGYNVTNNPQKYNVDKTASSMIEQAYIQKQAAIEAYAEAENFLSQYNR